MRRRVAPARPEPLLIPGVWPVQLEERETKVADTMQNIYAVGLRNAHALEKQATQLMQRQIERIESYPEHADQLRRHLAETETQIQRLDQILGRMGESTSSLKDTVLSFMGNMAALAHTPAQDEIMKNTFANYAFEHFEIAAYRSLIAMAEASGASGDVAVLRQSLAEEERFASWIGDHIQETTRKYMSLETQGAKAGI